MHKPAQWAVVLITLSLCACENDVRTRNISVYVCDSSTADKRAEFILQCIENGNPKSDEEPEDWIPICERMAQRLMCPKKRYEVTEVQRTMGGIWWETSRRPIQ